MVHKNNTLNKSSAPDSSTYIDTAVRPEQRNSEKCLIDNHLTNKIEMKKSDIGLIGLAVMGENLALNLESKGYRVSLYNRLHRFTPQAVDRFLAGVGKEKNFVPTYSPKELVESLKTPRKILLMIRAGEPVDETIAALLPFLKRGDTIIDGGNSDYRDTQRREAALKKQGIFWVGCGISGGEEGALHGPSIMPGGDTSIEEEILPLLQNIAAHLDNGTPCCSWIGPDGAGHFVKTVHNGIEYGDMQLIAEAYSLLNILQEGDHETTARTFETWDKGVLESYLIRITAPILRYRDSDGSFLIDHIADRAQEKGTGKWSVEAALESATPLSITTESLYARFLSLKTNTRDKVHRLYPEPDIALLLGLDTDEIHHALYAAKIANYAQGFDLLYSMSEQCGWRLNLSEIATIWQKGCIIQSRFLLDIAQCYQTGQSYENLLLKPYFREKIRLCLPAWRKVVRSAIAAGCPLPGMASALTWFDSLRWSTPTANLIQAQRDYFGAHGYERNDAPAGTRFHTCWTLPDNTSAE